MFNLQYYPVIESMSTSTLNIYHGSPNSTAQQWCVTEFIDGMHLAFYVDAKENLFKAATRHRFLSETEAYYEWQDIAKVHKKWMLELSKSMGKPFVVYGKLVGGSYDGESYGIPILSACEYCAHNEFIIHDIKVKEGYLPQLDIKNLSDKFAITSVPLLFKGEFNKVIGFPENKLSAVPFMFGLKAKFKNEMYGIVLRPSYPCSWAGRDMIMKKLNSKYRVIGKPLALLNNTSITVIYEIAEYLDNQATIQNMMDKVFVEIGSFTSQDVGKVAGMYTKHLLDNISYVKYNMLNKDDKRLVNKELNRMTVKKLNMLLNIKVA